MAFTPTEENYIKAIFHLQKDGALVSTNAVANNLHTSAASVTDMLKKLKSKKLLTYQKYKGFKLNAEGKLLALTIIRKHRLWEFFLVNKLNFGWDEVHDIAEELEHIQSEKLVNKLSEFLGHPKIDPHGDPIPDSQGKMMDQLKTSLADLIENDRAEVLAVGDQSSELLELLSHKQIQIGTIIEVKKKFSFDQSMEIKVQYAPVFTISCELAQHLLVKKK